MKPRGALGQTRWVQVAVLSVACAAAAGKPPTVREGAAGRSSAVVFLDGARVTVNVWDTRLTVDARRGVQVVERLVFQKPHGKVQLGVLDARATDAVPNKRYVAADWGLRDFTAALSGKKVKTAHVTFADDDARGWKGAFTFTVPANAREVEVRYRLQPRGDGASWTWDGRTASTFAAPPENALLSWSGLGDRPATQVLVQLEPKSVADEARWTFANGTLKLCGKKDALPAVTITVPASTCTQGRCGPEAAAGCLSEETFDCGGVVAKPTDFAAWLESARSGCYDGRSLAIARSWLFARHGQTFEAPQLKGLFKKQRWYTPRGEVEASTLSPSEGEAVTAFTELEQAAASGRCKGAAACY